MKHDFSIDKDSIKEINERIIELSKLKRIIRLCVRYSRLYKTSIWYRGHVTAYTNLMYGKQEDVEKVVCPGSMFLDPGHSAFYEKIRGELNKIGANDIKIENFEFAANERTMKK